MRIERAAMTCSSFDLSIIIVNYNGWDLLDSCLNSILLTLENLDHEIWVVDNGSTDNSVSLLREQFPNVKCIENKENIGFAQANNQALLHCKGSWLLLLNNDTIIHPNAVGLMIQALKKYPGLAAVGPQLINRDGSIQPSCMRTPSRWGNIFNYLRVLGGGSVKFAPNTELDMFEVDAVSGACMMVRREAIEQVGMLDGNFFMYAEESDWCYRARKLGWRIGYVRTARVTHLGGQTAQLESARFYVERRVSRVLFKLKHFGYFSAWWDALLICANIQARCLASPSQRDYYSEIGMNFNNRIRELFRQHCR